MFNSKVAVPLVLFSSAFHTALAQAPNVKGFTPLASIVVPYSTQLPYEIEPIAGPRGPAFGYNRCNSTTEGPSSKCQTMFVNSIDDFCLWAPPKLAPIGDAEGEVVAWCTKPGHGTRLIPPGALTGVQWLKMPDYIQIVGFVDQKQINIPSNDAGGELDPHGQDLAGNPIGGLVYSNAFSPDNGTFVQVREWTNFMGSNSFCFKICKPDGRNPRKDCQHIYDTIGCDYNAPNAAKDKVFEVCDAEDSPFVGEYKVGTKTMTYFQGQGAIPYKPHPPASSNCVPYSSAALYAAPTPTATTTLATTTTAASPGATGGAAGAGSSKASTPVPAATQTGAASRMIAPSFVVFVGAFLFSMSL